MLPNRSVPDVREKRSQWEEFAAAHERDKLVFLDESGINTDMTRRYGRAVGKARVIDHVPCNTPKNTTIVSSMRLDGACAYDVIDGSMNGEKFLDYAQNVLVPTLRPGDIVVMDNLRAHKVSGVEEAIASAGASTVYLPPYSPDLNPIEKMWSKVKIFMRKWKVRMQCLLAWAIEEAISLVTPSDCDGWFSCCGYCL